MDGFDEKYLISCWDLRCLITDFGVLANMNTFLRNKISVWALFDHHFVTMSSKKTAKCPWDGWPRDGRGCSFYWVSNIWAPCPREGQGLTTLRMPVPPQFQHFHQKSSFLCLWVTHVRTWRRVKVCFLSVGSDAFLCHRPRGCVYFTFSCFPCRFTMGFKEPGKSCFCLYFGRPCSLGWALFFTPAASPWLLGISVVLKWAWHHGTHRVIVSSVCHCLFSPWTVLAFLWIRVTLEQVSRHVVTTGIFGWWIMPRIWVALTLTLSWDPGLVMYPKIAPLPSGIRWWACKCCQWSKQIQPMSCCGTHPELQTLWPALCFGGHRWKRLSPSKGWPTGLWMPPAWLTTPKASYAHWIWEFTPLGLWPLPGC